MPARSCRWSSGLLALALAGLPAQALAQACCAGSSTLTPARLGPHEDAAVGAIVRATGVLGSFAAGGGRYIPNPAGTGELDGELDLVGAVRLLGELQLTLLVPGTLTWRGVVDRSEVGGGLGDLNLSARYDFFHAGQSRSIPGVAVLAGVLFPTGRPPEAAALPLATDSTGTGAWQLTGGLALEQSFGPFLVNLTGLVAWRSARRLPGSGGAPGPSEALGLQLQALLGVGYVFDNEASLAASLGYLAELPTRLDGVEDGASASRSPSVGLSGSWPLDERWRLQGALSYSPGVSGLGLNRTAGLGLSLSLLYVWS